MKAAKAVTDNVIIYLDLIFYYGFYGGWQSDTLKIFADLMSIQYDFYSAATKNIKNVLDEVDELVVTQQSLNQQLLNLFIAFG